MVPVMHGSKLTTFSSSQNHNYNYILRMRIPFLHKMVLMLVFLDIRVEVGQFLLKCCNECL